jgi:copper chaperone NosL
MSRLLLVLAASTVASFTACGGAAGPAPVDTKNDTCNFCRMSVSDPHLAAQIVAPGEEPRFFDDIGCLAGYLREHSLPARATIYVADHRTAEWVDANRAIFARSARRSTPMGSGLIAHATTASRADDGSAAGSTVVSRELALSAARAEAVR